MREFLIFAATIGLAIPPLAIGWWWEGKRYGRLPARMSDEEDHGS